jgi:hypothetical protein
MVGVQLDVGLLWRGSDAIKMHAELTERTMKERDDIAHIWQMINNRTMMGELLNWKLKEGCSSSIMWT